MTLTIEIGKGRTIAVTAEQLATLHGFPVIQNKMDEIALKNILGDANAGVGKREDFASNEAWADAALAMSMKKFDSMLRGEYRGGGERGPRVPSDPVAAEALREARTFVYGKARGWEKNAKPAMDWIATVGKALELPHGNADETKALLVAAIAKRAAREDVVAAAKAVVDARSAIKTESAEDLGL